jgi:hypothetical protein
MPRYGTEKLHLDINDDLKKNNIKMGRDKFFEVLRKQQFAHKTQTGKSKDYMQLSSF